MLRKHDPTFPIQDGNIYGGLTAREYAAVHIAAGLSQLIDLTAEEVAEEAVGIADALFAKLNEAHRPINVKDE
jgi:predicted O-methyltransferase YrrM